MPSLEVYYKRNTHVGSYSLTNDIITIGRAGDNMIVLPNNPYVSRYHSALIKDPHDPDRYTIRDLSSLQGIKVGKKYVLQRCLNPGDTIKIIDFELKYLSDDQDEFFKITDEISSQDTPGKNVIEDSSTTRFISTKKLYNECPEKLSDLIELELEQLQYLIDKNIDIGNISNLALDIAFKLHGIEKKGVGGIALFDEGGRLKCLVKKGAEKQASIFIDRKVIEKVKNGQVVNITSKVRGNELWMPLLRSKKDESIGFLYLFSSPYTKKFQEEKIKSTESICSKLVEILTAKENNELGMTEFIEWPRNDMVGNDDLADEIAEVAQYDINVLLLGESGVGKTAAAGKIHELSERKQEVFQVATLSSLSENLMESELFGHIKGAFTDAKTDKKGCFELANNGTIFLDEIGELSANAQKSLLEATDKKIIKRMGSEKRIPVNVRIIAATNQDLGIAQENGKFRSDLYFRLATRKITISPLRERKKDIPLQAHFFLDKFACEMRLESRGITPQAMRFLLKYSWPGNTRELENCIKSALSKSKGLILVEHLPDNIKKIQGETSEPAKDKEKEKVKVIELISLQETEKKHIKEILEYTHGNIDKSVNILQVSKQGLYNKIYKQHNLKEYLEQLRKSLK